MSFLQKNILLSAFFTLLVGITLTVSSFYFEGKVINDTLQSQGEGMGNLLVQQFDETLIKQGITDTNLNSETQKSLIATVDELSTYNKNIAQGYLFQKDLNSNGNFVTLATPTALVEMGLGPGFEFVPPPPLIEAYEKMKQTKQATSSSVYSDQLGTWFTVITPVLDKNGEIIAIFGIDMSASIIQDSQWSMVKRLSATLLILFVIAFSIQYLNLRRLLQPIKDLSQAVHQVTQGNLNIVLPVKSQDEVGIVVSGFNEMIQQIGKNMTDIEFSNKQLVATFKQVATVSDSTSTQAKDVLMSLEEITSSTDHLAHEAESGNHQLLEINLQIEEILRNTSAASDSITTCLTESNQGIKIVDALKHKSAETENITLNVGQKIYGLEGRMRRINDLLASIQDVAEQTGLLSLNASIEAARAGEHGRGFSVVAEEIRKLSTNSKQASEEIGSLLKIISADVGSTGNEMRVAEQSLNEQSSHIEKTIESFYQIRNHILAVVNRIKKVNETIQIVEKSKETLLITVESVSSMSEQTAASVEMIQQSFTKQLELIHQLNESCRALQEQASSLNSLQK